MSECAALLTTNLNSLISECAALLTANLNSLISECAALLATNFYLYLWCRLCLMLSNIELLKSDNGAFVVG